MAVSAKTLVKVTGVVGSCIGVPLALRKTNLLGGNSQSLSTTHLEIKTIEKKLTDIAKTGANRGNCSIEELSDEYKDFLLTQKQGGKFYVEIFCENTKSGDGVGALPHIWTGLFPVQLLTKGENLSIGEKLNLVTEDATEDNIVRTVFKGTGMKNTITGTWGEETVIKGQQSVRTVYFSENTNIKNKLYLLFP